MKQITKAVFAGVILMSVTSTSGVFAQAKDPRGGRVDTQMKKLHAMMPMFSLASAELEVAIEKGDTVAAKAQSGKILAAVPDLTRSTPHKNRKQIDAFRSIARNFGDEATTISLAVEKGDFISAIASFKKLESLCMKCHTTFRD